MEKNKEKIAFITGASKRIGKKIALYLASKKYQLILHYNQSEKEIKYLKSFLEKKSLTKVYIIKGDLENEKFFLNIIPHIKNKFQKLDLIIHNASIFLKNSFLNSSINEWNKNFNINFRAPFFISKDYVKYFDKGHIINILDSKIHLNSSEYTSYLLSKKALYNFSLSIVKDIAPHFRMNNIAPGYVLPPDNIEISKKRIANIPLQKKPKIKDILKSIQFLISNTSVTGQTIYIDGGENI